MALFWLIVVIILLPVLINALPLLLGIYFIGAYLYLFWQFPLGKLIIIIVGIVYVVKWFVKKSETEEDH